MQLGAWIKSHRILRSLDLHWNHIAGTYAVHFVTGLIGNSSTHLTYLNMAWNPLAPPHVAATAKGCKLCASLAQFLKCDTVLTHLDLSMCDLGWAHQLEVISEALKENHTLLGLHVTGNMAMVDALGYLVPRKEVYDMVQEVLGAAPTLLIAGKKDNVPHKKVKNGATSAKGSCCWVCDGWSEVHFWYSPLDPGAEVVHLFTSADDFTTGCRLTMRAAISGTSNTSSATERPAYSVHSMCPPGEIHFVFQIGTSTFATSPIQPVVYDKNVYINGTLVRDVNVMTIERREGKLIHSFAKPRIACDVYVDSPHRRWHVDRSLFAPFNEDRGISNRVFEHDWSFTMARGEPMSPLLTCKDSLGPIREILSDSYALLLRAFPLYCTFDESPHAFCPIGWSISGFTSFLLDFGFLRPGSHPVLSLATADALYFATVFRLPHDLERITLDDVVDEDGKVRKIAVQSIDLSEKELGRVISVDTTAQMCGVAFPGRSTVTHCRVGRDGHYDLLHPVELEPGNEEKGLVRKLPRCAFIELILRIATALRDNKLLEYSVREVCNRITHVTMNTMPPPSIWRTEALYTEQVEEVIRKHLWRLRKIYNLFKVPVAGTSDALHWKDWRKLMESILPDYKFSSWRLSWVWYNSIMDKPSNDEANYMLFVEFIEAIVRISLLYADMTPEVFEDRSPLPGPQESLVAEFTLEPAPFLKFGDADVNVKNLEEFFWDLSI